MTRQIVIISGGLSELSSTRRLADRLGQATQEALQESGVPVHITTLDLRPRAHDITNATLSGFPTTSLQEDLDQLHQADGIIAATPIYNGSYSGLFKSFVDLLGQGVLEGTPVLLAATAGTARHSLALEHALRPLFSYLRALTVPTGVFAASEDWGGSGGNEGALTRRIDRAAGELADLVAQRPAVVRLDEFQSAPSFSDLLGKLPR